LPTQDARSAGLLTRIMNILGAQPLMATMSTETNLRRRGNGDAVNGNAIAHADSPIRMSCCLHSKNLCYRV